MSEADDKELKLRFIQDELSLHGDWLCEVLTDAIEKQKLISTQDLHQSISYRHFQQGDNPGQRISFLSYGRALDIAGYKRKNNESKKHEVNTNRDVWGMKLNRQKEKKTQWYAKNMYGGLNRLISHIMYGLSDIQIARIKDMIEEQRQKRQKNNG